MERDPQKGEVGSIWRYGYISVYEVSFKFTFDTEFFNLIFTKFFCIIYYKAHTANLFFWTSLLS